MKIEYLQHIYTWSGRCITGNKLGWGIVASATPTSLPLLREIEKLAADAQADSEGMVPVEEMIYSPIAGFVRMTTWPGRQGEDGRRHKYVHILHPADPDQLMPEALFAGPDLRGTLDGTDSSLVSLPRLSLPSFDGDPGEILREMGLYDSLPALMRAVCWSLMESHCSLNIVADHWKKEDFAAKAARLMYAIFCLLPESLRKRAGYLSYAVRDTERTAFYFSEKPCGKAVFILDEDLYKDPVKDGDELSEAFYDGLLRLWKQDRDQYPVVMEQVALKAGLASGTGRELDKLQWVFYDTVLRQEGRVLSEETLARNIPELIYWGLTDQVFMEIAERCIRDLDQVAIDPGLRELYLNSLVDRVSGRSLVRVSDEIARIMMLLKETDPEAMEKDLLMIKEKNSLVYNEVMIILSDGEETDADTAERIEETEEKTEKAEETEASEAKEPAVQEEPCGENLPVMPEADYRVLPARRTGRQEEEGTGGSFVDFLLLSLPIGFLTGCVMFLSHYSLMIGHWKIAVGMGGMWLILILHYLILLKSRQHERPLWMGIGLSLLTGELIEIAASYFIPQEYRMIYFIILGAAVVGLQIVSMFLNLEK